MWDRNEDHRCEMGLGSWDYQVSKIPYINLVYRGY